MSTPDVVSAESAAFLHLVVPVAMFSVNAIVRRVASLPQSAASDLMFIFLVWDVTLMADPHLAAAMINNPTPGRLPSFWMTMLVVGMMTSWFVLLLLHEKPIHEGECRSAALAPAAARAVTVRVIDFSH